MEAGFSLGATGVAMADAIGVIVGGDNGSGVGWTGSGFRLDGWIIRAFGRPLKSRSSGVS